MSNIIKNYNPLEITKELLYNTNDWDLVELNYNIDPNKLQRWFEKVDKHYKNLWFTFDSNPNKIDVSLSKELVEKGYCGYYCGPIEGMSLAWPIERYEPLPPPTQCNLEEYPEVNKETFVNDAKILSKLRFGYFDTLINELGEDSFRQALITRHYPGMYIKQHVDSKTLKLHIPIQSDENAYFHFGENRDRSYHMKPGKVYILNTGDWHGTSNNTDHTRTHIITRVTSDHILKIIGLENE